MTFHLDWPMWHNKEKLRHELKTCIKCYISLNMIIIEIDKMHSWKCKTTRGIKN